MDGDDEAEQRQVDQTRVAGYAGRDRRQTTGTAHTPGRGKVPVENGGDDSHWRGSVIQDEIMSGKRGPSDSFEALSAITIQALADLGYFVDVTQADAYRLPTQFGKLAVGRSHKDRYCLPIRPRYIVDKHGKIVKTADPTPAIDQSSGSHSHTR